MAPDPQDIRVDYFGQPLLEAEVDPDPIKQFQNWFEVAVEIDPEMANAMTLSTVSPQGQPSSRVVLLKGIESGGFVFYTNYASQKGEQLASNPRAALCFWWPPLLRQVRIEGAVEKVSRAASLAYFHSRPRGSQIGALASDQSRPLTNRAALEARAAELEEQYEDKEIPLPSTWGGYRLVPTRFEFWQGRVSRLHDRICYTPVSDASAKWKIQRLAP